MDIAQIERHAYASGDMQVASLAAEALEAQTYAQEWEAEFEKSDAERRRLQKAIADIEAVFGEVNYRTGKKGELRQLIESIEAICDDLREDQS